MLMCMPLTQYQDNNTQTPYSNHKAKHFNAIARTTAAPAWALALALQVSLMICSTSRFSMTMYGAKRVLLSPITGQVQRSASSITVCAATRLA